MTAAPAVMVVFVCSVLPLAWMGAVVLANPSARAAFSLDRFHAALLARTVAYNLGAAAIATLMGLPAGFVLGRGRGFLARVLWVVLPAALLMPSLSYAYGWNQLVRLAQESDRVGQWLRSLGITFRPTGPADVLRCIWALGSWLWAVPAGLIGLALRRMDTGVQQQAVLDGALRRVTLRQLLGPIVASLAIVTCLATQEFAVYEPTGISVVATEVRMVFDTGAMSSATNSIAAPMEGGSGLRATDQPARAAAAVATALPLLGITALLASVAAWGAAQSTASDTVGVGAWPRVLDTSGWTLGLTGLLVLLNVGVPIAALLKSLTIPLSPTNIWEEFRPPVTGAMIVAGEAAALALLAALSASGRWTRGSLAIAATSFLAGGQLLAIGLIRIYNRPGLAWAYETSVVPVLAYLGRFGWLAIAAGRSASTRPWRELRDIASVDGANAFQLARSIIWPLAWPMLLAGGLLVGALSLTEVPATVLLMPQNPQVMTPMLMTWVHNLHYNSMIEASLLMMAAVLVPAVGAVGLAAVGLRAVWRGLQRTR